MTTLPKAPIRRIFKEAGANRVSDAAVERLHNFVIEQAEIIASNSVQLAGFNNRKTVQEKDIDAVLALD